MITEKEKNIFKFNTKDYILYILNNLEPNKSDKIRLNKIAFFVEFAYIFSKNENLSNSKYAAINNGPVIDGYDSILKEMEAEKLITIDGFRLRPLVSSRAMPPVNIANFITPVIDKYSKLNHEELIALSHQTDSYKITTDNEKIMGCIIDKKLASLETFFSDSDDDVAFDENKLPAFDKCELIKYGL